MRNITKLIIHCAATTPDMDIGAKEIRLWHMSPDPNDPSKPWPDIGYHWVIDRSGLIEAGRPEARQGAHCTARNGNVASIGICMVGGVRRGVDSKGRKVLLTENNFTDSQWFSLELKVRALLKQYPGIDTILGHRDLDPKKDCPSFSVRDWEKRQAILVPLWPDFSNVISRISSTEAIAPAR